jgi:acyl-CoA hydrolase
MEKKPRTIAESATSLSQIILPSQSSQSGLALGGELLKMMDNTAYACAMKHSHAICVTAGIDTINFHAPVKMGHLVTCSANLSYVSNRSMEIAVNIDTEDLQAGSKQCCMTAYFIFVALDENKQPLQLEPLTLTNEIERQEFEAGRLRMQARKENPKVCWLPLY